MCSSAGRRKLGPGGFRDGPESGSRRARLASRERGGGPETQSLSPPFEVSRAASSGACLFSLLAPAEPPQLHGESERGGCPGAVASFCCSRSGPVISNTPPTHTHTHKHTPFPNLLDSSDKLHRVSQAAHCTLSRLLCSPFPDFFFFRICHSFLERGRVQAQ